MLKLGCLKHSPKVHIASLSFFCLQLMPSLSADFVEGMFLCKGKIPVSVFVLNEHVTTASQEDPLECCIHGDIKIEHIAPDLVSYA